MKRIIGISLLTAEVVATAYSAFMAYLLSAWMESDDFALQTTGSDWLFEGGKRLMIVCLGAFVAAAMARAGNERLFRLLGFPINRMDIYSAVAIFILIVASGAIGSIEFIMTRPFL